VTLAISVMTKPRAPEELRGLVYGLTATPKDDARNWYERPLPLAVGVGLILAALNLWFW